jgi:uncharacterized protein YqhQ
MNDFIGGIALGAFSIFLLVSKNITEGHIVTGRGGIFVRADTYVRMLGGLMLFLSFLMAVRSINFKKAAETRAFTFVVTRESLLTVAALLGFIVLVNPLGFLVTTFLFSFAVICLYAHKENEGKELGRRRIIKKTVIAGVFSLVLVGVVYVLFSMVLMVVLP